MSKAIRELRLATVPLLLADMARRNTGRRGILSADRVGVLDQGKIWPSANGDRPIAGMSRDHAGNAASWLNSQAAHLCYHHFADRIEQTGAGPDDGLTLDALEALGDPNAWLADTPLMRALNKAALSNPDRFDR